MECKPCQAEPMVAIVGGTHGNEMAGINLIKRMQAAPAAFQRRGFQTWPIIANPEAVRRCTRFVDCDLNRCMTPSILSGSGVGYEQERARVLAAELQQAFMVLDIHNTTSNAGTLTLTLTLTLTATSNVGTMLIAGTDDDPLTLQLLVALVEADPTRRVWLNKTVGGGRSS